MTKTNHLRCKVQELDSLLTRLQSKYKTYTAYCEPALKEVQEYNEVITALTEYRALLVAKLAVLSSQRATMRELAAC